MNKYICLLYMFVLFWACNDDESMFNVGIAQENISFKAIPGGAVMYYELPSDLDVMAIRVRYKDAFGQHID